MYQTCADWQAKKEAIANLIIVESAPHGLIAKDVTREFVNKEKINLEACSNISDVSRLTDEKRKCKTLE